MDHADQSYSFSFITGALFAPESAAILPLLAAGRPWPEIEEAVAHDNLLKSRTAASRVRLLREIRYRLSALSEDELAFAAEAPRAEVNALLFVALCRHYAFIREFVLSVLRPKALTLDFQITPADFSGFLYREAQAHPEIERLTDKSAAKVRQVVYRMLAEAGLIASTRDLRLTPHLPGRTMARLVAATDGKHLRFLLLSDNDIRTLIT